MKYIKLKSFVTNVKSTYASVKVIGRSVLGKNIYGVFFNYNPSNRWVIVTAGIHAREHLSTDLVVKQIADLLKSNKVLKYNIAFVPQVNPDGADIVINGIGGLSVDVQKRLLAINKSTNFTLYKANANGVDLNNNFNANWWSKFTKNYSPSSQGFYGSYPHSEPEVKALVSLTTYLNPFMTISYHLKGEEIYFDFFQSVNKYVLDAKVAKVFADSTGYTVKCTQHVSSGGYKDWCVKLGISSLTIELGDDKFNHPYPKSELKNIYNKNKNLVDCLDKCYNLHFGYKK